MAVQVIPIPTEVVSHSLPFPFPILCFIPIPMEFPVPLGIPFPCTSLIQTLVYHLVLPNTSRKYFTSLRQKVRCCRQGNFVDHCAATATVVAVSASNHKQESRTKSHLPTSRPSSWLTCISTLKLSCSITPNNFAFSKSCAGGRHNNAPAPAS